jgi:hypothetical protein
MGRRRTQRAAAAKALRHHPGPGGAHQRCFFGREIGKARRSGEQLCDHASMLHPLFIAIKSQ